MTPNLAKLAFVFTALTACASAPRPAAKPAPAATAKTAQLRIKLTTIYVDDQDKALRFYTDVLGFVKKADVTNGPYRWLTVASPKDPDGAELQLALDPSPATKAYQEALFQQGRPAAMLFTEDVQAEYDRLKTRGAELTMPPTDVSMAKISMVKDTVGNLIQLTQLY